MKDKNSFDVIHKKGENITKSHGEDDSGGLSPPREASPLGGLSILGQIEKARRDALKKQVQ